MVAGDPTFDEVFEAYASFVVRSARYLGVREADLDDVVQEVFLVVHRRLGELESPAALRTWIYSICLRIVANYRRGQRRKREEPAADVPEGIDTETPSDLLERQRAREAVLRALEGLDDDKRDVFVLFELEELPMNEVSALLGCPLKTAYSRLYAARARVTEDLHRYVERSGG